MTKESKEILLMRECYKLADILPEGSKKWLIEFAGNCLEVSHFDHDGKTPEQVITKLLQEYVAEWEFDIIENFGNK